MRRQLTRFSETAEIRMEIPRRAIADDVWARDVQQCFRWKLFAVLIVVIALLDLVVALVEHLEVAAEIKTHLAPMTVTEQATLTIRAFPLTAHVTEQFFQSKCKMKKIKLIQCHDIR